MVPSRAVAILTVIANLLAGSLCKLADERYDEICSKMLSWIFGAWSGNAAANRAIAALTTSVGGGLGSTWFFWAPVV